MNENSSTDPPPRRRVALTTGWASLREFIEWTQEHPEGFANWEQAARRFEAGESRNPTPEFREAAAKFIAFRKQKRAMEAARPLVQEIMQITQAPPGSDPDGKQAARFKALWDELADVLLDWPEPERSRFFERITPLREKLKATERRQEG
jgi:hypothetical protein